VQQIAGHFALILNLRVCGKNVNDTETSRSEPLNDIVHCKSPPITDLFVGKGGKSRCFSALAGTGPFWSGITLTPRAIARGVGSGGVLGTSGIGSFRNVASATNHAEQTLPLRIRERLVLLSADRHKEAFLQRIR